MASQAARGKKALDASDYQTAIKEYTAAIKESPTSPDFFIQRSIAYMRNKQLDEALSDAEQGILNGYKRAKKESIIEAQFRRGVALYQLGRYADAALCLDEVKKQKSDHKQADMWINKNTTALSKLPEDDERRVCKVTIKPSAPTTNEEPTSTSTNESKSRSSVTQVPSAPTQTPVDKIRYEWYQNTENIYFTLLAKGVPKDKAQFEITEHSLSISFPLTTGSSYDLTLEPLFAPVIPAKCITRVMPSKTEIILIKATAGQKWPSLESSDPLPTTADASPAASDEPIKKAIFAAAPPSAPSYPTSSRNGPKDWDKVAHDLRSSDAAGDGKTPPDDDGDDDDDYEGGDEANHFFKKLFKGASPDMQRAMMKSYTESNGTSLSTNWEEVSKGKVETLPPDGMEAKPWSS